MFGNRPEFKWHVAFVDTKSYFDFRYAINDSIWERTSVFSKEYYKFSSSCPQRRFDRNLNAFVFPNKAAHAQKIVVTRTQAFFFG